MRIYLCSVHLNHGWKGTQKARKQWKEAASKKKEPASNHASHSSSSIVLTSLTKKQEVTKVQGMEYQMGLLLVACKNLISTDCNSE